MTTHESNSTVNVINIVPLVPQSFRFLKGTL